MNHESSVNKNERGFSLMELLIALTLTIMIMGAAVALLAGGFNIRAREDRRSDALADAQRAINIMSREIGNSGFNLTTNGIVASDSNATSVRVRSNLNRYDASASSASQNAIMDPGEDVKYFINSASNTNYLVRYDRYAGAGAQTTVLANRMDSMQFHYFAQRVTYSTANCDITGASAAEVTPSAATYVVIASCVQLPAVGVPGAANYQPVSSVLIVTDVALRNAGLTTY